MSSFPAAVVPHVARATPATASARDAARGASRQTVLCLSLQRGRAVLDVWLADVHENCDSSSP